MANLLDDIINRGAEAVRDLVRSEIEESLHLEFKSFTDRSGSVLTKEDRKTVAKAVCGFSNAEGGLLVIGVETRKQDGVDVACAAKPVEDAVTLRNKIWVCVTEALGPPHGMIEVRAITDDEGRAGFVVVHVPPSDLRPHMSLTHHQYFRRGSDSTRLMEPGEIKDLMLAPQFGVLEASIDFRHSGSTNRAHFNFEMTVTLRNTGRVPVVAPYVVPCRAFLQVASHHQAILHRRKKGVFGTRDALIHVDDELEIGCVATSLMLNFDPDLGVDGTLKTGRELGLEHYFTISGPKPVGAIDTHKGEGICFDFFFGAENAPRLKGHFVREKWDMLDTFEAALGGFER